MQMSNGVWIDSLLLSAQQEHSVVFLYAIGCARRSAPCLTSSWCLPVPRSALHDRRFSPIDASELSSLDVSVSLLVKYEQARHWEDWEVR